MFGFRLPENFDRPYLAASPREFWQRWHISLSTWLRDYLYVSLGGNRGSRLRTRVNLLLTMLLGGLWHGAAWYFVVWGGYHGGLLVAHRAVAGRRPPRPRRAAATMLARMGTFRLVVLGWVFFRAPSLAMATEALARLGAPGYVQVQAGTAVLVLVTLAVVLHLAPNAGRLRESFVRLPATVQGLAYAVVAVAAFFLAPASGRFIYFQF